MREGMLSDGTIGYFTTKAKKQRIENALASQIATMQAFIQNIMVRMTTSTIGWQFYPECH